MRLVVKLIRLIQATKKREAYSVHTQWRCDYAINVYQRTILHNVQIIQISFFFRLTLFHKICFATYIHTQTRHTHTIYYKRYVHKICLLSSYLILKYDELKME